MAAEAQLTPMMAQYRRIKGELPKDALLLFRLGDFYEMFFEDAQVAAGLLNVALTKRGVVPMCGVPFHAANAYIGRLLRAGRKVAICDQVEEARPGQLVKREVTQILRLARISTNGCLRRSGIIFSRPSARSEKSLVSRWPT
jgi:DNA mismatch repair protein MutS